MNTNSSSSQVIKHIFLCQIFGLMASVFFSNGFFINYMKKLNFSDEFTNLTLLLIPSSTLLILILPLAHLSDRVGMKRIGQTGNILSLVGFSCLGLAIPFPATSPYSIVIGLILFFSGNAFFSSNWFALIDPAIDPSRRGRFFALLRSSWQLSGMTLTAIIAWLLKGNNSLTIYGYVIAGLALTLLIRTFHYQLIPEHHAINKNRHASKSASSFANSLNILKQNKAYMKFCRYTFSMSFCLGPLMTIVILFEKQITNSEGINIFTDSRILMLGNMLFTGALAGFWLGGYLADHWGNPTLFRTVNILQTLIIASFASLAIFPDHCFTIAAVLAFLFGLSQSTYGIGNTSEAMRHIKGEQRAFCVACNTSAAAAGACLSAIVSSSYLKFAKNLSFNIGQIPINHYQIYILAMAVFMLVITYKFNFHAQKK